MWLPSIKLLVNCGELVKSERVSKLPRLFSIICHLWDDPPKVALSSKWRVEKPLQWCLLYTGTRYRTVANRAEERVLGRHEKGEEAVEDSEGSWLRLGSKRIKEGEETLKHLLEFTPDSCIFVAEGIPNLMTLRVYVTPSAVWQARYT